MRRILTMFMWLSTVVVCSAFGRTATLQRVNVLGGVLSAPVVRGNYMYVGTGVSISVWDMTDATRPVLAGRTNRNPELGPIVGLAVVGNYLYAGWNGGITIYSLAHPAAPVPAARFNNYVQSDFKLMTGLAGGGGYVYVGDANNGLIVIDASKPLAPKTVGLLGGIYEFDSMAVFGSRLLTSGTSFIGDRLVHVVDVSSPSAPAEVGFQSLDGFTILRAVLTPGYAIGVGLNLQVYDLSHPAHIVKLFDAPIDQATQAIRHGNMLYLVGNGLQVWDFTNPSAPVLLRTVAMQSFATDIAADTAFGPVILTHADRGLVLGVGDPANPVLAGSFAIPFGVSAHAAAFDDTHTYVAEEAYGLATVGADDVIREGRYDAALPLDLASRDMEGISVDGGRAYLAAWGYGVLIVDLSNPARPTALGRFPLSFATAIEAHGSLVYVATATDAGVFGILDVSDPKNPVGLGGLGVDQTLDLTLRGNYAFLATRTFSGPGGLAIVDVSDPAAPVQVGANSTCAYAYGVDVSADGGTTYIACAEGSLEVLDTRDKANPVLLGSVVLPGDFPPAAYSVVVSGSTAYVGNDSGVDEVDVSNAQAPVWTVRHHAGFPVRKLSHAPNGHVFAFAGLAGTYEFAPVTK